MVITTVAFESILHRRLAIAAVEENASIVYLVQEATREWLDRRDRKAKKAKKARRP